jgi:hypothetical protein
MIMNLDTLVARADPVRHRELDQAGSVTAEQLYRRITRPEPARRPRSRVWLAGEPARRLRGGRPTWPAVLAVIAVLATAAVVAGVLTRPATRPAAAGRAPVAAVLDAAAVRAAHGAGAGRPPGPGQYLYVNEVVAKGLGSGQGCPEAAMTVRAWVAADGSGRQIGTFPAPCGKLGFAETYQAGGLPWWLYGYVKAGSLPTDPAALQRAIVRRFEHGHSRPSATFVYAATFLNAGSPPPLRAALYRVIEALPGVQNLGTVTDQLGRPGQGIGLVTAGARTELIFDPATTSVLEEETVAVARPQAGNNQLAPGTVMQYTLYVQQGVVNSARATPPRATG